jgi:hypothetical protein
MKKTAMLAALAAFSGAAVAGDLALSISVGQPGFFGQLDFGAPPPPPALIFPQPIVVVRDRGYAGGPVYLHVPPGYERHWARYCAQYGACGRPVYFVRDEWYQREYVPRYQERYRGDADRREPPRDERQERDGEHDRGEHDRGDHGRGHDRDEH